MKSIKTFLSFWLIAGASSAALAADGVLVKEQVGNYCHLKFPAIEERTLAGNRPVLKDPSTATS